MICPWCSHAGSKVVDSRDAGSTIRRRRECEGCGDRFTTHETIERRLPQVVKKDGERQAFDGEKLQQGMGLACRKRPVTRAQIDDAVDAITQKLASRPGKEIRSTQVGELVLEQLLVLDRVAYLRFASVYQELASPEEFLELLQPLLRR
jgi:transcriptional repressor NrdR